MNNEAVDYFGEVLMLRVRDPAIKHWDMVVKGQMKDAKSKYVHEKVSKLQKPELDMISELIPLIVNTCMHQFLVMLEQEEEKIKVSVRIGDVLVEDVAAESDGLAGELYGDRGWLSKFGRDRLR